MKTWRCASTGTGTLHYKHEILCYIVTKEGNIKYERYVTHHLIDKKAPQASE